jgi:hypothetical protein
MPLSLPASRESSLRIRVAPEELTLVHWPLRQQPVASALAVLAAAGTSGLAGWATGSPLVGGSVAAVLLLTLWRTVLPVRYELSGSGIVQSLFGWRRRIPWTAILQFELDEQGVLLLPDAVRVPLSPLRGLYLRWGDKRGEVLAHLEYYLQSWHVARPASQEER